MADTDCSQILAALSAVQQQTSGINSRLSSLEARIASLESLLRSIKQAIDSLGGQISQIIPLIAALQNIILAGIESLKSQVIAAIYSIRDIILAFLKIFTKPETSIDYSRIQRMIDASASKLGSAISEGLGGVATRIGQAESYIISQLTTAIGNAIQQIVSSVNVNAQAIIQKVEANRVDLDPIKAAIGSAQKTIVEEIRKIKLDLSPVTSAITVAQNLIIREIRRINIDPSSIIGAITAAQNLIIREIRRINIDTSPILGAITTAQNLIIREIKNKNIDVSSIITAVTNAQRAIIEEIRKITTDSSSIIAAINNAQDIILRRLNNLGVNLSPVLTSIYTAQTLILSAIDKIKFGAVDYDKIAALSNIGHITTRSLLLNKAAASEAYLANKIDGISRFIPNQINRIVDSINSSKNTDTRGIDSSNTANNVNQISNNVNQLSRNVDKVLNSLTTPINGVMVGNSCSGQLHSFNYSGNGLLGLREQINALANVQNALHPDVCTRAGQELPPNELLERVYQILGGDNWFTAGQTPSLNISENSIKSFGQSMFGENSDQTAETKCTSLIDLTSANTAINYYRLGLQELPATLPESLISKDEGFIGNLIPNPNATIHNYIKLFGWYVERYDELMGQWELAIEVKDTDPSTPGEQPKGIKLPNLAEATAEIFLLAFQAYSNTEILLNLLTRNLIETGTDKQQNFITYKLLQSLTDWVGFKQKDISLEMPLTFSPEKTRYDEIMQESKVKVNCVEFDEKFGLEADFMRFREAAAILQAQYKRKLDPNGDIQAQILKYILDTFRGVNKVNGDDENLEEFFNQVENGFTDIPSVGDPTQPYGRPYEQRPKIRDLSQLDVDEQI